MGKDGYGFENYIIKCFVLYCNITTTFMKMQVKFFKSFGEVGEGVCESGKAFGLMVPKCACPHNQT